VGYSNEVYRRYNELVKQYNDNSHAANFFLKLASNFGDKKADQMSRSPYFQAYITTPNGNTGAVLAQAAGTSDPNVIAEIEKKWVLSGRDVFDFANQVAANPSGYSETLSNTKAIKEGTDWSKPQIEQSNEVLKSAQKEAEKRLSENLAARGLTYSGSVEAGTGSLAEKYSKAMADAAKDITNTNIVAARNKEFGNYDRTIANTYAQKLKDEENNALHDYQVSNQPTAWDYISAGLNLIPGISALGGLLGIGGKKSPQYAPGTTIGKKEGTAFSPTVLKQ
jgi:hypothetical protein